MKTLSPPAGRGDRHAADPAMISSSAPVQLRLILPAMARLDLSDEECEELLRLLRGVIDADRFPLSPRIRCLRQILEKLEPPVPAIRAVPSARPPVEPTHAKRRRR